MIKNFKLIVEFFLKININFGEKQKTNFSIITRFFDSSPFANYIGKITTIK